MRRPSLLCAFTGLLFAAAAHAADPPLAARWDFGAEESTPLRSQGGVHRDVPGPRPPDYPDFEPTNTAVKLDGSGAHLEIEDPGAKSAFDFTNGDELTLEAWVQVTELKPGENAYVIGKGRTGGEGFAADNQNWALRVREVDGQAGVSFLFATVPASGAMKSDAHWHRWTSTRGFKPGSDWHHIAVAYKFGDSKSIRGWIDGQPQKGAWDIGGATNEAPLVDDDDIWIGSSRGGAAANSFRGALDAVAIYRQALDDATMKTRFRSARTEAASKPAPEAMPTADVPPGAVLLVLREGLSAHDRWLTVSEQLPPETRRVPLDSFLLERLPQRFDGWGIRDSWNAPVLAQFFADISLPPGRHRFLLRVRGLSRLWANDQVIARSQPLANSPSGEEPITPVAKPPYPGLRVAEHRQQEIFGEATIGADGKCRLVLETFIGGKAFKTDPGELCVAVEMAEGGLFKIVEPDADRVWPILLTDGAVTEALARLESKLGAFDEEARRAAAASQNGFWEKRHELAHEWAQAHPAPAVPKNAAHPIDAFLQAKTEHAIAESAKSNAADAEQFHTQILPILRDNCFRCHGVKEQGGLRLNSRAAALKGGESESPAVVPGKSATSELVRRIRHSNPEERMPPGANALPKEQIDALAAWIDAGASWPAPPVSAAAVAAPTVLNDSAFLRRIYLDTVGEPPTEAEIRAFLANSSADKRARVVDRLLADPRWADHWMSYWQDVLAENPTLLNPSLNTTGPFRWFLYDALRDDKPFDRLVTELILLRGSQHEGGSAGFGLASDNDAPLAAKGQIVAGAFLGIELQCARCHDSPYHSTKQRDLYSLAAMFDRKPVTVPKTSRVPAAFFEKKARASLIRVTLKPDESIAPKWPFATVTGVADDDALRPFLQKPDDTRERLAALITSPHNSRFAPMIANRVWRRLLGAGLVEPPHDWEGHDASHPELLAWLANEFIRHDYSVKHVAKLILTSQAYQREATGHNLTATPELRFFVAPDRRRLSAEQVVDSMFTAAGRPIDVEEFTFDADGRRPASNRLSLGRPERAWMFATLNNERDRPALSLPRARAVADILEAFGWSGSRQSPRTDRESSPNLLQPGVLANSTASVQLTRAVATGGLADLAVTAASPEALVESVFLRYLGRLPTAAERQSFVAALAVGFAERIVPTSELQAPTPLEELPRVTWSNHLRPEASTIGLEAERRARAGPPPDPRLRSEWRDTYEDFVWSVVNLREFVWLP